MSRPLSNVLPTNKFWVKIVTKKYRKLKKEYPDNPFLSHDEKTRLFLNWKQNGDTVSRDKLLDSLYPLALQLVHKLVDKLGNNNVDIEDLEQEANYALLYTLEHSNYDPKLGTLATYFRSRLPMFFFRALKDYGNLIRIPDNILKDMSAEQKAFDYYVKSNGYYPEIGEQVIYKGKKYDIGKTKISTIVSGNKSIEEDDNNGAELFDLISDDSLPDFSNTDDELKFTFLNKIVKSLTKQEQEILYYAFYTDLEISEIVYLLKPYTKYDKERLYKRSKNVLTIITSEGKISFTFFVYKNAKNKRQIQCNSDVIRPISHTYLENFQERSNLKFIFAAKEVISIFLNDKDITFNLKSIENESFSKINADDQLFELNCELKTGSIYSLQNYNNKLKEIKDKLRKKIVKYEVFK